MEARDPRFSGLSITTGTVRYSDLSYLTATHDEAMSEGYIDSIMYTLDRGTWYAQDQHSRCVRLRRRDGPHLSSSGDSSGHRLHGRARCRAISGDAGTREARGSGGGVAPAASYARNPSPNPLPQGERAFWSERRKIRRAFLQEGGEGLDRFGAFHALGEHFDFCFHLGRDHRAVAHQGLGRLHRAGGQRGDARGGCLHG